MKYQQILALIFIGIISRLLPHPPNFTAIDTLAIVGLSIVGNIWTTAFIVFSSLFFSDLLLGFHTELHFIYLSYSIIMLLGYFYSKPSLRHNVILLTSSALIFFIITNFGSWLNNSLYPKTFCGLGSSYVAALPFLANQVIGNLFYSAIILSFIALFSSKKAMDS